MILFLTSSPCDNCVPEGISIPCILNEANDFVLQLKKYWKPDSRCLFISADPENFALNDEMIDTFQKAFSYHGLTVASVKICDSRNADHAPALISESDVIVLAGGHVPTQNAFFCKIHLMDQIQNFPGIVMGISAGTMNCAATVYSQPELEGESQDPAYSRFFPGLGLTDINVLPHYQQVRDSCLDGKRLFEDITYPDSHGRCFLALPDGSYVLVKDGASTVYGEAYEIRDGMIQPVCQNGFSYCESPALRR